MKPFWRYLLPVAFFRWYSWKYLERWEDKERKVYVMPFEACRFYMIERLPNCDKQLCKIIDAVAEIEHARIVSEATKLKDLRQAKEYIAAIIESRLAKEPQ